MGRNNPTPPVPMFYMFKIISNDIQLLLLMLCVVWDSRPRDNVFNKFDNQLLGGLINYIHVTARSICWLEYW